TLRQDVLRETPQELFRRQRQRLGATARGVVLGTERDFAVLEREQPLIADRHPVRVAGQILENTLGASKWRLGVNHPILLTQWRQPGGERRRLCQRCPATGEGNIATPE